MRNYRVSGVRRVLFRSKSTRLNSSHTIISYAVFCDWSSDVCSRSEEHTSELQSHDNVVCRLLVEKKKLQEPHGASLATEPLVPFVGSRVLLTASCVAFVGAGVRLRWPCRVVLPSAFFFFNERPPPEIYPLPLPDPLPI